MSRLSQVFWFLNASKIPTLEEQRTIYTAITITPELKRERRRRHPELVKAAGPEYTVNLPLTVGPGGKKLIQKIGGYYENPNSK